MKKMTKQRLMGLALVAISAAILWLASTGETVEDRDATAVLITLPSVSTRWSRRSTSSTTATPKPRRSRNGRPASALK